MFRRSAVLAALGLLASIVGAQPQNYAQRGTQIRAGIALIDSAQTSGFTTNATPFVWYNLDSNRSVKPAGWNIYNPNAPGQASAEIANRWGILSGGGGPAIGERINKQNAAYWEFRLSQVSEAQLAQYDVLFVNAVGNVSLNSVERERLRQFVDRGGVLWVEVGGINYVDFTNEYAINGFPLPFAVDIGGGGVGNLDVFHPVLSYPNAFNAANLDYLNAGTGRTIGPSTPAGAASALNPATTFDFYQLKPVVLSGGSPTMMVGRIGEGFMVVTSRNAATFLNRVRTAPSGWDANNRYYAVDPRGTLDRGSDVLGKLAVNIISLGSGSEQPGGGSRKSGSSPIDIGAPLLQRFQSGDIPQLDFGPRNPFPVAAYKGLLVVSANNQIRVYDANPNSDIDGDGNPDDGVQDLSQGDSFDLIWESNALPGPISAPTCIEVAQPGVNIPSDQILVTLADGSVAAFNAFPAGFGAQAPVYVVPAPSTVNSVDTSALNHGPYAPTYHEGLAYVATNPGSPNVTGQVWVMNPAQGSALTGSGGRWLVGDPSSPILQQISAPPTVGYIPIADNSSGHDKVVYVPTRPGGTLGGPNAGIFSLWAGTRGESPISATVTGSTLTVTTRASQRGLFVVNEASSRGVKLTVLTSTGDPLTISQTNALFSGGTMQGSPGVLDFTLTGAWDPTYTVRVDYTIDWGRGAAASQAAMRGNIFLPDDQNNRRTILGNIAMSPRGTIYVVHSTANEGVLLTGGPSEGGAFYAFREQGQGAFRCIARYDAYRQHTINLNQTQPISHPATIDDNDPLTSFVQFGAGFRPLEGAVNRLTYVTGPVVRGDYVYVAASMRKIGGISAVIPNGVVFAFYAEPEAPEIVVGQRGDNFQLVQPDTVRSTNKGAPNVFTTAGRGQFQYISETGKIRFDSLMTPNRGQIANCFSLSGPVIVRGGGSSDEVIYPDRVAGSRWSPLAWYTVLHGIDRLTSPVVTGGTLFVGGASALPSILVSGNPGNPTATLWGANADISERDPFNYVDPLRPANRQAVVLKSDGAGGINTNPNLRWPQNQGVTSFDVWATRVLQASMSDTDRVMSLAAGDGGLFATASLNNSGLDGAYGNPGRVYGFSRSDFVVVDEGRLGRYDPAGNPIFATDMTNNSGADVNIGGASAVRPIQRPHRAYPVGSDLVVVDPPTNRVIRLDNAGRELRSIEKFQLDPVSGITMAANEPLTLNNPRDVAVFTEYVNNPGGVSGPQAREFWIHYVIADAGNRRIIDVIDRYQVGANGIVGELVQVSGVRQLGILRWRSPAEYSGKQFEYNSITRAASINNPSEYWYVAGIGSATPTTVDVGLDTPAGAQPREARDGNGGIVIFNPILNRADTVINEVTVPGTTANVYVDPATGLLNPNPVAAFQKKLSNLNSVTVRTVRDGGVARWAIMFTDSTGVYEIVNTGTSWEVRWMLPEAAYKFMRMNFTPAPTIFPNANPRRLRATYARRLDSGDILLVNGYVGTKLGGANDAFSGEVIQVSGAPIDFGFNLPNLGFTFDKIRFELNLLTATRPMYQPVFADRR